MTEKKQRFTIEPTMMRECILDNTTGEQLDTVDYTERLCEVLNELHEENEQLKQELFESEIEYLMETYSDNPVRKNDKIHSLKKEFKERFGRDYDD